jgi:hypothetical protein
MSPASNFFFAKKTVLKNIHSQKIVLTLFERQDWSYSAYGYESLKEELPSDMPVPHSQLMTMSVFIIY